MNTERWLVEVSAYGTDDRWRDIASGEWVPGSEPSLEGEEIPLKVRETLSRNVPMPGESGFWDIKDGNLLYRVTYKATQDRPANSDAK